MDKFCKRQLLIRGQAFATFSTIEKALVGRKKSFGGSHGLYVVQAWFRARALGYRHFNLILSEAIDIWGVFEK